VLGSGIPEAGTQNMLHYPHNICYPLSKQRYLATLRDIAILDECEMPIDMKHSLLTQSFTESLNSSRLTRVFTRIKIIIMCEGA